MHCHGRNNFKDCVKKHEPPHRHPKTITTNKQALNIGKSQKPDTKKAKGRSNKNNGWAGNGRRNPCCLHIGSKPGFSVIIRLVVASQVK